MKKSSLLIILLLIVSSALSAWITRVNFPEYKEVIKEGKIDSTLWVARATYESTRSVYKDLKEDNEILYKQLKTANRRISNLTNVNAELNLEIDDLKNAEGEVIADDFGRQDLEIDSTGVIDTTLTFTRTFGNGLFKNESVVTFENNEIKNELKLNQLRPLNIKVVTTTNKEQSEIITYVTSEDFSELNIENKTTLKRKKKFPWFWVGVGAGAVAISLVN